MNKLHQQTSAAVSVSSNEDSSRREFLGQVSAIGTAAAVTSAGAGLAVNDLAAQPFPTLLSTVPLGNLRITRLILGGNPIYGHSHFNQLYSQHLRDYHTPERVMSLLREAVAAGINTWQNSYAPRTMDDVRRIRNAGIDFNWLLLGKGNWVDEPGQIEEAAALKPDGIAPHGSSSERLHRAGKLNVLKDMLQRIRNTGVMVGLSAHNPEVIEIADQEQWDVDYYMCCLYYHNRPKEEFQRLLGHAPMGEVYLPSDRDRMLDVVARASKPCLVYKVLAAGRANLSPAGVRDRHGKKRDKMAGALPVCI